MRIRWAGMLLAVVVLATTGCSRDATPLTMDQVGRTVAADPLLNWHGSWRWHRHTMTADIRTTADAGIGTIAIDGLPGQVVFEKYRVFVKAPAAYWTRAGETKTVAAQFADRWMDDGTPESPTSDPVFLGMSLDLYTPDQLGRILQGRWTGDCAGDQPSLAAWSPTTSATAAVSAPAGVPADAVRFANPPGADDCAPGTYWVSGDSPHQLLAYRGAGQPVTAEPDDSDLTATTLTVRAGTAAQAATVRRQIAGTLAGLPTTVPVNVHGEQDETASVLIPSVCYGAQCAHLDLDVTGGNTGSTTTIWMRITVTVTSEGKSGGRCHVTMAKLGPGDSRHAVCSVTDSRVAKIQAGQSGVEWSDVYDIDVQRITEKLDPAALAAALTPAPVTPAPPPSR